jgi:hypothetical protein
MTPEAICHWFKTEGWRLVFDSFTELVFHDGRQLPKGVWRQARIDLGHSWCALEMWLTAASEQRMLMGVCTFDSLEDLPAKVGQFGVASWDRHVTQFAKSVGLKGAA